MAGAIGDHDFELIGHAMELMKDPEEGPFIMKLFEQRPTAADRRAYARWLRERDDPRGELLELALDLAERDHSDPDPAARERFLDLFEQIGEVDPLWWRIARPPLTTLHCGEAEGSPLPVRFSYACPMLWEQLTPTAEADVRHCATCDHEVFFCDTHAAAEQHARKGHCITVPARLVERYAEDMTHKTGRPEHPVRRWARLLFGDSS